MTAAEYYVSSGTGAGAQQAGNDNNPGTLQLPFRTLQKAVSMMHAGDTMIVRGGEYDTVNGLTTYGGASAIPSGTSWTNATTLKEYPGEQAVFRRYMPAGAVVDEITYRDSWHLPTYADCVANGITTSYPYDCWSGGAPPGLQEVTNYPGAGPDGYVLQFSNDFPNPAQYIIVDGIDLDGRGICNMLTFYAAFHLRFQNLEMRNSLKSGVSQPGLNDETLQTDLQFIRCKIYSIGVPYDTNLINGIPARKRPEARFRHAWYMHTGGNSLIGCEVSNAAGTCLQPAGDNNVIIGNFFHDCNGGVYIDGNNWTIANNLIYHNGQIEIYHRSHGLNTIVRNNTIVSGPANPFGSNWGVYLGPGSQGTLYENNLIVTTALGWGVNNDSTQVHTLRNNLIVGRPGYEIYEEWGVKVARQNNIIGQDPKFVDAAALDFRVLSGSPAIDNGYPNGLTTDRLGAVRPQGNGIDIGAYESTGTNPPVNPPSLPVVTLSATDATAAEGGSNTGTFTVSRTGSTSAALTVNYAMSGSASNGSDYGLLSGTVTIAAGQSSAAIVVATVDDSIVDANETVVATLSTNAGYSIGSPATATVSITDNDSVSSSVTLTASPSIVAPGATITVTWTVTGSTFAKDWISLYAVGAGNSAYDHSRWIYTNGAASGSTTFTAPSAAQTYEVRYLVNDSYTSAASSNTITVSNATGNGNAPAVTMISVTIQGTTTADIATLSVNGATVVPVNGTWSATIVVPVGTTAVDVLATDTSGKTVSRSLSLARSGGG